MTPQPESLLARATISAPTVIVSPVPPFRNLNAFLVRHDTIYIFGYRRHVRNTLGERGP
jgi:hypothetical protein